MQAQITTTAAQPFYPQTFLFTDKQLIRYFNEFKRPLPFGLVRLVQDRKNGCLGGVPHRQIGGKFLYNPEEVSRFLDGLPIIQARPPAHAKKTGRPSAGEKAEAIRKNITVSQLRSGVTV